MSVRVSVAGLAAALAIAGCKPDVARLKVLVLGATREPATLDPAFTQMASEQEIVRLLFRDLTTLDDAWTVQPDLAAALPVARTTTTSTRSAFGVRWRLKPDLKWSDGEPLTAGDVRFGWTIEGNPKLAAVSYATASEVADIRVIGPRDFEVAWKQTFADYQAPRVHAVLPEHAYPDPFARTDRPFVGMTERPVSSGPFRVLEHVPGQHLTLERNPHWRGAAPALDRIVFRFFPSADGFEAALATGAIDALGEAAGVTPDRVRALSDRLADSHVVTRTDGGVLLHLDLRHDHPALDRLDVRRALSAAIDRRALAEVTYDGLARPAFGLFPPRHPGHDEQDGIPSPDLEAARAVVMGLPPAQRVLRLGVGAGSPAAARAAAHLQASFQAIGFEVTLRVAPMKVLFEQMESRTHPPLVLYAWRVRPDWDGASALRRGGRQNHGAYANPEMDATLDALTTALDPAKRRTLLRRVERLFRADLPAIPLVFRNTVSVRPKGLKGWRPTGTVTPITWNAEDWAWPR